MNDDADRDVEDVEPASNEELAAAARLRDALEGRDALPQIGAQAVPADEVLLARALPHVFAPRELDPAVHARLLATALAGRTTLASPPHSPRSWRTPVVVTASLGGALALAASVLLFLGQTRSASAPDPTATNLSPAAVLVPRSAEPLFVNERQPLAHRASARVDRIASARSGEYLQARLTRWGAR